MPDYETHHRELPARFGRLWEAATAVLVEMDQPRMTIERLRQTEGAKELRIELSRSVRWLLADLDTRGVTSDQKLFLQHWLGQMSPPATAPVNTIAGEAVKVGAHG
ncbi:MAG: hypothetical protein M3O30_17515 [Planctomycetota bacterium]|nr:hypothetical protein [Planctomycetota bacterium]